MPVLQRRDDLVAHQPDFWEYLAPLCLFVKDGRKGRRFAIIPVSTVVAQLRIRSMRVVEAAKTIPDHVRAVHDDAVRPRVVVCGGERAVDVAVLERGDDGALVDKGDIDFLSQAYPEGGLAETAVDGRAFLRCDEDMGAEEVAVCVAVQGAGQWHFDLF